MITNPFESDAFSVYVLSQAIQLLPNNYGRVRQMGLMPENGVRSVLKSIPDS